MRKAIKIKNKSIEEIKKQILLLGDKSSKFVFLNSNNFNGKHTSKFTNKNYDFIAAIGSFKNITTNDYDGFSKLKTFDSRNNDWLFGYFTYDLKNEIENLSSHNSDNIKFPALNFFVPKYVFYSKNDEVFLEYLPKISNNIEISELIKSIQNIDINKIYKNNKIKLTPKFTKEKYLETISNLKKHIQKGDIYEVTFCQEFYGKGKINPISTYFKLNNISPTPFSSFAKFNNKYLISASPERFIKKEGNRIISQPIKGTIKKGNTTKEDNELINTLKNDKKERAENTMIVDLVRNDLSQTAKKGSVKVDELCGIYSFEQVHQMISTISSEINPEVNYIDVIKKAFPMGSMTGAPKVRAMKIIEEYEQTKRGLFSGAIGYITPDKDFDFNVIIRSMLYDFETEYLSFIVGGAITNLSIPIKEYEECMLKAKAMIKTLNN
ncbi:MAG: anthranilate synthase component I family protein [Bacteroidales bacterium]|jgi:para-aminobenzoate synthetase component 1|nr:anthranilate synthase component I family protein [Bacteroidales bacterium]